MSKWFKGLRGAVLLILFVWAVVFTLLYSVLNAAVPVGKYKLIINKSTMSTNIYQERKTGCLYGEDKNGTKIPLLKNGEQVCEEPR